VGWHIPPLEDGLVADAEAARQFAYSARPRDGFF
jgi:hypothetical protein